MNSLYWSDQRQKSLRYLAQNDFGEEQTFPRLKKDGTARRGTGRPPGCTGRLNEEYLGGCLLPTPRTLRCHFLTWQPESDPPKILDR